MRFAFFDNPVERRLSVLDKLSVGDQIATLFGACGAVEVIFDGSFEPFKLHEMALSRLHQTEAI